MEVILFPSPSPFVAETTNPIFLSGQSDYFMDQVSLIGNITGSNLSSLDLQKMQMISGLLSEFQTLKVTGYAEGKVYSGAKPVSISFSDSDLTTILPYSVSFEAYSSGTLVNFLVLLIHRIIGVFQSKTEEYPMQLTRYLPKV